MIDCIYCPLSPALVVTLLLTAAPRAVSPQTQLSSPKITPNVSAFISQTESTLLCHDVSPDGAGRQVQWETLCPKSPCPESLRSSFHEGNTEYGRLQFNATPLWNGSVITCSLKERSSMKSSVTVHIIGRNSLQIYPPVTSFEEGSEVSIRCSLTGEAAISRAADLRLAWFLDCIAYCPPSTQAIDSSLSSIRLNFNATSSWNNVEATCRSTDYSSVSTQALIIITAPDGELTLYSVQPVFLRRRTATVICTVNSTGASAHLVIDVTQCSRCRFDSSKTDGRMMNVTFLPDVAWKDAYIGCYKYLDPGKRINLIVKTHEVPKLSITPPVGTWFYGEKVTMRCHSSGIAEFLGVQWGFDCLAYLCPAAEERADATSNISLSFTASKKWDGITISCILRHFPEETDAIRLSTTDQPTVEIFPKEQHFEIGSFIHLYCAASAVLQPEDLKWTSDCPSCPQSLPLPDRRGGKAALELTFEMTECRRRIIKTRYSWQP